MATPLLSREQVGLRPPRSVSRDIRPEGITVHYMGPSPWTTKNPAGWDHARCPGIWRAIQAHHMDVQGWSDVAYSSAVCPHGTRLEGRGPGVRTGANGNRRANDISYAVCGLWGDRDELTAAAKRAFTDEAVRLGVRIRWPHDAWTSTSCPGDALRDWVNAGCPAPDQLPPFPQQEEDEMPEPKVLLRSADGKIWLCQGITKVHVRSPKHADLLRFLGVRDETAKDSTVLLETLGTLKASM